MGKYAAWIITCNKCGWEWETVSKNMIKEPRCYHCGSTSCSVRQTQVKPIKKAGKIITDIAYDPHKHAGGEIQGDIWINTNTFTHHVQSIRDHLASVPTDTSHDTLAKILDTKDFHDK